MPTRAAHFFPRLCLPRERCTFKKAERWGFPRRVSVLCHNYLRPLFGPRKQGIRPFTNTGEMTWQPSEPYNTTKTRTDISARLTRSPSRQLSSWSRRARLMMRNRITGSCRGGIEIGAAWKRMSERSGNEYVSLSFEAPEFGRTRLFANLGKMPGQDDPNLLSVIWNADDCRA